MGLLNEKEERYHWLPYTEEYTESAAVVAQTR